MSKPGDCDLSDSVDHGSSTHKSSIVCPDCSEVFQNKKTFKEHKKTVHSPWCSSCQKYFDAFSHLDKHNKTHHAPVTCPSCSGEFPNQKELMDHQMTAHPRCEVCQKTFKDQKRYDSHTVKVHLTYKCTICSEGFSDGKRLSEHQKSSHPWCDVCKKVFTSDSELEIHNKSLHSLAKCTVCSEILPNQRDLKMHMASIHPPQCFECNISFKGYSQLHRHTQFMHSQFNCNQCQNKKFRNIRDMKDHGRQVHNICDVCHKKFSNQDLLKKHDKDCRNKISFLPRSRNNIGDSSSTTYFWCTICLKTFKDHLSRNDHNEAYH